jgi:hypothetical protein
MAKKITQQIKANLEKNTLTEKGGAWLLSITIFEEGTSVSIYNADTAWANPSAAKRWIKKIVLEKTPRKSLKLSVVKSDNAGKPILLTGDMTYKVEG